MATKKGVVEKVKDAVSSLFSSTPERKSPQRATAAKKAATTSKAKKAVKSAKTAVKKSVGATKKAVKKAVGKTPAKKSATKR